MRAASALGRGDRVASSLDALYAIRGFGIGKELVRVARYAEKAGDNALGLTVLEEYLARYPRGAELDEVHFRLGSLLEKAWEGRDLKRSRASYETVLRDYPTSSFALAAGEVNGAGLRGLVVGAPGQRLSPWQTPHGAVYSLAPTPARFGRSGSSTRTAPARTSGCT